MRKHYPLNLNGVEDAGLLPWSDGIPATGVQGSYPGQALVIDQETEILAAIAAAGLSPAGSDLAQLIQAVSRGIYLGGFSGSANALSASLPNNVQIPVLLRGMRLTGSTAVANTGAVTVTLSGFKQAPGTVQLLRRDGQPLQGGDLPVGPDFDFRFDGANCRLTGVTASELAALHTTIPPVSQVHFGTVTGSSSPYTVANLTPAITALTEGMVFELQFPAAVTDGASVRIMGADGTTVVGTLALKRNDGSAMLGVDAPTDARPWFSGYGTSALRLMAPSAAQATSNVNSQTINYLASQGTCAEFRGYDNPLDLYVDANAALNYQTYQSSYTRCANFTVPAGYVRQDLIACFYVDGKSTTTAADIYFGIFRNANDGTGWVFLESQRVTKPPGQIVVTVRPAQFTPDPAKSYTYEVRAAKDANTGQATGMSGTLNGFALKL